MYSFLLLNNNVVEGELRGLTPHGRTGESIDWMLVVNIPCLLFSGNPGEQLVSIKPHLNTTELAMPAQTLKDEWPDRAQFGVLFSGKRTAFNRTGHLPNKTVLIFQYYWRCEYFQEAGILMQILALNSGGGFFPLVYTSLWRCVYGFALMVAGCQRFVIEDRLEHGTDLML